MITGTPHFMSPEQAEGDTIDHRSDLFSLATVLAEMITGEQVFSAERVDETVTRVRAVDVDDILEVVTQRAPTMVPVLNRPVAAERSGTLRALAMPDADESPAGRTLPFRRRSAS